MSEDETTTEVLAEIEGQVESTPVMEYTPPEGWRVLRFGEQLLPGDVWVSHDGTEQRSHILHWDASAVSGGHCIRRIEPQPEPQPEPQAATIEELRSEVSYVQNLLGESRQRVTQLEELVTSLRTINRGCENAVRDAGKENLALKNQLEAVKAESAKRLETVQELRSEVSHVQGLWGESRRRVEELETLVADLRAVNAAQEKAINSAARDKADLQHRLDTVAAEWAVQAETIRGLQTQLEAVKAEVSQVSRDRYLLQVELDAREQVPEAVSDRFDQGFEQGTARAVETIAEWTEVFRTCGSQALAYHVMQNLPHIMRTLTGLADTED